MILTSRYGYYVQKKQIVARNFKKVRLVKALEIETSQVATMKNNDLCATSQVALAANFLKYEASMYRFLYE